MTCFDIDNPIISGTFSSPHVTCNAAVVGNTSVTLGVPTTDSLREVASKLAGFALSATTAWSYLSGPGLSASIPYISRIINRNI